MPQVRVEQGKSRKIKGKSEGVLEIALWTRLGLMMLKCDQHISRGSKELKSDRYDSSFEIRAMS
jgi:hypothetical protein